MLKNTSIIIILFLLSISVLAYDLTFIDYTGRSMLRCCYNNGTCDSFLNNLTAITITDLNYSTCYEIKAYSEANYFDYGIELYAFIIIIILIVAISAYLLFRRK